MGMVFIPYIPTIRHHATMGGDYFIADVVENSFNPFVFFFSDDYTILYFYWMNSSNKMLIDAKKVTK